LGDLFDAGVVGAEVQLIGRDYLNSQGASPPGVVQLLADVSGMDQRQLRSGDEGLRSRFHDEVSRRIATELASGELVQLHGYFVAPTFGRLCAAIVLVAQT